MAEGRLVDIGDTRLFVEERGAGSPVIVLHGGPGFDHHAFADYLDPLGDRYRLILVDERAQGRSERPPSETWTLEQMARDITSLAQALGLERYATLGHSFGAFLVLQHAVDDPGAAAQTIVSSGVPSVRYLEEAERNLDSFEPADLRERIAASFEMEKEVRTPREMDRVWRDQSPFHFADPLDPRIDEYNRRIAGGVAAPEVLRHFAELEYGGIDLEDRLDRVTQPVLVLAGRYDRVCPVEAAEAMAKGISNAELVVFEHSGHMTFVEENEAYVRAVRDFLDRHSAV